MIKFFNIFLYSFFCFLIHRIPLLILQEDVIQVLMLIQKIPPISLSTDRGDYINVWFYFSEIFFASIFSTLTTI